MASSVLMTGVGSVFAIDATNTYITEVAGGAWVELFGIHSGSQELSIESEVFEIRNGATGAVDGLVFFNQKTTMNIELTIARDTKEHARELAVNVNIVPGMQMKLKVTGDTLAGSTAAEGSIPTTSHWSIMRATRTRSTSEVAKWSLELVRYGDNDSVLGTSISAPVTS